jgi:PTH1 family peptidyl-tRNA hydrolase
MALFHKKPDSGSSAPLYTLGLNKSCLIVGLGNPGKEYDMTRHNIGFDCVESLAKALEFEGWVHKKDMNCSLISGQAGDQRVIMIKPDTFMNESGRAVQAVMHFYKITSDQVIVIHDELDIEFGKIQTKYGGGSAGHNGLKSIIQHIGENFARIRVGIGKDSKVDPADYVLSKFSAEEQKMLPQLYREANAIVTEYLYNTQVQSLGAETRSFII